VKLCSFVLDRQQQRGAQKGPEEPKAPTSKVRVVIIRDILLWGGGKREPVATL